MGKAHHIIRDGIKDAPPSAQADMGIAIGTHIAMESAHITLMSADIRVVLKAITLSRISMRTIHQNLFWAFAYNVTRLPITTGILYPLVQAVGGIPQPLIRSLGIKAFSNPS